MIQHWSIRSLLAFQSDGHSGYRSTLALNCIYEMKSNLLVSRWLRDTSNQYSDPDHQIPRIGIVDLSRSSPNRPISYFHSSDQYLHGLCMIPWYLMSEHVDGGILVVLQLCAWFSIRVNNVFRLASFFTGVAALFHSSSRLCSFA